MEGVVTEVEQVKPENVEDKTVSGKPPPTTQHIQDASFHMRLRLRRAAPAGRAHVSGCYARVRCSPVLGH
jgi:hypothetical protein